MCPGIGAPIQTDPVSGSGRSGVAIDTVPTLDALGQARRRELSVRAARQSVGDRR